MTDKERELFTQALNLITELDKDGTVLEMGLILEMREALAQPEQKPVGFYVYKPVLPQGVMNINAENLPWVYDQAPSSGYSARMFVYTAPPNLAQPEQEPVGWFIYVVDSDTWVQDYSNMIGQPLYTAQPKREWVGLTQEEVQEIAKQLIDDAAYCSTHFAIAIEAELRRKNNAV